MKLDELNLGLKLELSLYNKDGAIPGKTFISEFEWSQNEDTLFVATPIYEGRVYPVSIDTKVVICFLQGINLYEFSAKVVDREVKNNLSLLKLEMLSDIEKIQRREFFRFDCLLQVDYRKKSSLKDQSDEEFKKAITSDLSGGGICIKIKEIVEKESFVECKLSTYNDIKIPFIGKVVRLTKYDKKQGEYTHEIGVLFEKIDEKDRDRIISFIFQEQRRLIKKG